MDSLPQIDQGQKKVLGILAATVLAFTAFALIPGFTTLKSEATCYKSVNKCHGIPVDECIGWETRNVDFEPKDQCNALENITSRCNKLKQLACETNTSDWRSEVEVHGKSCETWNGEYDLGFQSSC